MTSNARLTPPVPDGRLLPFGAVADRCNVTPRTVRRWLRAGVLRGIQLTPRTLRIPADALEQFTRTATAHR